MFLNFLRKNIIFSCFLIFSVALRGFRQRGKDTIYIRRKSLTPCTRWHREISEWLFEVFKENYFRVSCFNGCTGFSPGGRRYDFYTPKNSNPLGPRTLKVLVRWIRGTLPLPTPTHIWIRGTFTHTHATQTHPRQRTPTTHVHTCACTSYTVVFLLSTWQRASASFTNQFHHV